MLSNGSSSAISFHSWLLHYATLCVAIASIVLFYNDAHKMLQQLAAHKVLLTFNAVMAERIVGWFDVSVYREGLVLGTRSYTVEVAEHCDGLLNIVYLCCIVILFPFDRLLRRLYYAAWLIAFMLLLNVIRIATVLLAGRRGAEYSLAVHDDIWPIILHGLMFLVVLVVALRFKKKSI